MKITYKQLLSAVEHKILTGNQAEKLWLFWQEQNKHLPIFNFTNILYYLGGLIAIGAMSLFMNLGWERLGGIGLFSISVLYAIIALSLGEFLLKRYHLVIPASILITFIIVLTPLAFYGLEKALGVWDSSYSYRDYHQFIDWRWLVMELATVFVAICLICRYRFSFLFMPLAFTLWYMSLDLAPYLFHLLNNFKMDINDYSYMDFRKCVSLWFGLLIIGIAFIIDIKNKCTHDFAFWIYLSGVISFWGTLSSMYLDNELGHFFYCCINLLMLLVGAALARRVFVIFGSLGIMECLSYLSYKLFNDSLLFPFALTTIGLFIIAIGIVWQRHEKAINHYLLGFLPKDLRKRIEFR